MPNNNDEEKDQVKTTQNRDVAVKLEKNSMPPKSKSFFPQANAMGLDDNTVPPNKATD